MKEQERENNTKKTGTASTGMKLFSLVTALIVLGYFGVQIYNYFSDPYSTHTVYAYQVEDTIPLNGWVVRDEQVLTSEQSGIPSLERSEGERLGKGNRIAVIYEDQEALEQHTRLQAMEEQLEQLRYAKETSEDSEVSLRLGNEISHAVVELQSALSGGGLTSTAEDQIASLKSLLLKWDYTYSDAEDLGEEIDKLSAQIKELRASASSGAAAVKAPRSGMYSAVVDGYEAVLTPAALEALTPDQLEDISADSALSSDLGKLIFGDAWYYAAVMEEENASDFRPGDPATLRFAKGLDRQLPVTVESVGEPEDGRCVVVFSCRKYLSELTLLRRQAADVICNSYAGLRVPQDALRVVTKTSVDEKTGEETTTRTTGVYCVMGMNARFKPVNVLYTGNGFCLVSPASSNEKTRLRAGDQAIVSAEELYDGKVLN